jgi:hypothetical protein
MCAMVAVHILNGRIIQSHLTHATTRTLELTAQPAFPSAILISIPQVGYRQILQTTRTVSTSKFSLPVPLKAPPRPKDWLHYTLFVHCTHQARSAKCIIELVSILFENIHRLIELLVC